jgi:hypothetical protein
MFGSAMLFLNWRFTCAKVPDKKKSINEDGEN